MASVQKLLGQIQDALRHHSEWLGLDASKPQRILDYGCGNGTVSTALLNSFPLAIFRGLDNLDPQTELYNEEAFKLLGPNHQDRMSALTGDLHDTSKTPILDDPEWFGFDSLITSFALHHFDDPICSLALLKARVKPGGTVVVVDWLKKEEEEGDNDEVAEGPAVVGRGESQMVGTDRAGTGKRRKYNPENMMPVPMGRIWPGFSLRDIREDCETTGLTDVNVRIWPEEIELPRMATFGGRVTMYISKATVPLS
ncbi:S-adenosyl-L-methionine-dependent methyltransferase [Cercophora newfieldiana]|uniref:S-adenosyl-L-methionine-dependent methyltransferase n=1 Tax=Cercophora newfieldiana TaxID=92897 RepID=A0AA39YQT0_9PEZI|nr:S-adenosyl-L-methionine-dependent methyltransferase [Cercophora newfieldiana]